MYTYSQITTLDKAHQNPAGEFMNAACDVNEFGGIQAIVDGLLTNTTTGIPNTKEDMADRRRM